MITLDSIKKQFSIGTLLALTLSIIHPLPAAADSQGHHLRGKIQRIQLGPRPFFLINDMNEGPLKEKLQRCAKQRPIFRKTDFSIGHRGAAMQFPEHSRESYEAAARMGAGIVECDVTFTKDKELVCRHSQCDLHTTTNIVATPLGGKCSEPFQPAQFDADGNLIQPATAKCCTSDITLAEFKTLKAKMDGANPRARTPGEYLLGTPDWRTDLYSYGTVMTHQESIELFKQLGVKFTPELKSPSVPMPFDGLTQEDYAQKMIDEYKDAGIPPGHVYAQSFNLGDIVYWINHEPEFGEQAVYLDGRYDDPAFDHTDPSTWHPTMEELVAQGVKILSPPLWMLLALDSNGKIVPSIYAKSARAAGLDIIAWTFERSDLRQGAVDDNGNVTWYYQTIGEAIQKQGDMYEALDVLAKKVGILGIFSDWPATVTFYANCMKLD
ncbi:glycerophosphoryl diester phosphodiesterase [Methylomarinovum caldicuralii]|uniref:glycerophosphodiester phosphodiesterase n=1 Tax=Methylomarinovum caldicuralii TaxID=438856 RepID=A0AAU9C874_9GAMM|nr:glycerophosphodiester phosphodiesterase family protein [Methylomarinovum caldicuralii]BCX80629.1 glycerophosphoryl diester phosphodiesterase [Methylomarinovum caldicuralii]